MPLAKQRPKSYIVVPKNNMCMKQLPFFCCCMALLAVLLSSCKGDAGPQGPAGAGTVIYSDWYTGTWQTASPTSANGRSSAVFNRAAPPVTQAIIDNGVVLGYMRGAGASTILSINTIVQLPYLDVPTGDPFKMFLTPGIILSR